MTGWTRSDPNATTIRITFGASQPIGTKCAANATGTGTPGTPGTPGATSYDALTGKPTIADLPGTATAAQIPTLDAAKVGSGTLDAARIPTLDAAKVASGTLDQARIPTLDAAKLGTGTLDTARLPTIPANKLPTTAVTPGTYGSGTQVPQVTVDDKGRVTAVTLATVVGGGGGASTFGQLSGNPTDNPDLATALGSKAAAADVTTLQGTVTNKLDTTARGAASGVAPLDAGALVPTTNLPTVPLTKGGTGSTTAAGARTAIGAQAELGYTPVNAASKGAASGVAPLDTNSLVPVGNLPDLDAAKVATGTFASGRIPTLDGTKIGTGLVAKERLGTGTKNATTVLHGDGDFHRPEHPEAGDGITITDTADNGKLIGRGPGVPIVHSGSGAPTSIPDGLAGEFYFDASNSNLYYLLQDAPTLAAHFRSLGQGVIKHTGSGTPGTIASARQGDLYLNTTTGTLFYALIDVPNAANWKSLRGMQPFTGTTPPGNLPDARIGDVYTRTDTGEHWIAKVNSPPDGSGWSKLLTSVPIASTTVVGGMLLTTRPVGQYIFDFDPATGAPLRGQPIPPVPTSSVRGGVLSGTAPTGQMQSGISASTGEPLFADLPFPSATKPGGVTTAECPTGQYSYGRNTDGTPKCRADQTGSGGSGAPAMSAANSTPPWMPFGPAQNAAGVQLSSAAKAVIVYRIYTPAAMEVSKVRVRVTTVGATGTALRVGIYSATCGSLLGTSTAIVDPAVGQNELTFTSAVAVPAGAFALAFAVEDTALRISGHATAGTTNNDLMNATGAVSWYRTTDATSAGSTLTLPGTCTASQGSVSTFPYNAIVF